MAAAVGIPEDADAVPVHDAGVLIPEPEGVDRRAVVRDLPPRVQVLARLTVAGAEAPVIEDQGCQSLPQEVLRVLWHRGSFT